MELPDELLKIIREYAKPCLRYPNAYKEVLRVMKLKRWPELMKQLSGSGDQPKKVLSVIKVFLVARQSYLRADQACYRDPSGENRATREAFYEMLKPTNDSLLIMVYGKNPDFRWSWAYADEDDDE